MSLRLLRLAGWTLGALLGLALLGAWLVPPMLDWSQYRDSIAELVSDKLGRAVRIEGPVSLSLLPQPILTAGRISVADADDGVTIALAELRLRLALGPLLTGHVDAQELVLRGLDVRMPWPLATGSHAGSLALRPPTWLSSISARVQGGRLVIGRLDATDINATLGTQPDTGSFAIAGTTQISGQSWHLTTRLTRPGADGTAGLDFSLDGQGKVQGLGTMFSGQIGADGTLAGHISGGGPDLSRLLQAPSVPFRVDGRLGIAAGLAVADQLAIEIAGSPARGAVSLRLQPSLRLDVSLAASRLDLDSWLPALLRGPATTALAGQLPTSIDLSAEAATLATGTLRGLRGRLDLGPVITLHDASATLPGDAQLRLNGMARRAANGSIHFEGPASLTAANLRTTLGWLQNAGLAQAAELPPGVLRSAELQAGLAVDTGAAPGIALTGLKGTLDGSPLQGTLTLRPGQRLGVSGALNLDRLDLTPWLPAGRPALATLPGRFARLALDLRLSVAQARLQEHELTQVTLDMATEPGKLTLRQFEAQSQNVHIAALGSLQDGGRLSDARLELQAAADQAAPALSAWLPDLAPLAARLPRGAAALTLTGAGTPDALALRGSIDLGDLHIEAQPVLNLGAGSWTSPITLRHPGAPRLLDGIGLPGTAAWLGDGSLSLVAIVTGNASRLSLDSFDISAGSLRAGGSLILDRPSGPTPSVTGHINADTLPLPLPYPRSPDPLPTGLLSGWQAAIKLDAAHVLAGLSPVLDQASAQITVANGIARMDGVVARLDSGTLSGSLAFNAAAAPPAVTADLALSGASLNGPLFELPLDITEGQVNATASLAASGHSPRALLATLSGSVKLNAHDGTLAGVDLSRMGPKLVEADLRAALADGTTKFTDLSFTAALQTGALTFTAGDATTPFGTATLQGLIDLAGRSNELRLAIRPAVDDPPEIALRLSGPLDKPIRTPETAAALPWRAQHPLVPPDPTQLPPPPKPAAQPPG